MFRSPEPEYIELLVDMDYSSPGSFYTLADSTRPSSTNTGPMPRTASRHSLDSGFEEPNNFQQDFSGIDDSVTTLSHVNSMASAFTSTDAGSPDLHYDDVNTAQLFRPPPIMSIMLWPSATCNPLSEVYGSSAITTSSDFQIPNFGAQMMPLLSHHQGYQQGWPQDTTSPYTLEPNMNPTSLDLFLPPPALPTRLPNAHHPRAYSESTLPTTFPMERNPTSHSEGSISNSEEYPSITTTTPHGHTRHRVRTNRRLTMSSVNTSTPPRASVRRRASTRGPSRPTTTASRHNSSGGDRSRTTSGPGSPEITRSSRGQHTHGAFSCPLSPYGCESNFTSKNEWKRHVITKHLKLGYYECSLCPADSMRGRYQNSRKDLFSQHIWRMHLQTNEPPRPQQSTQRSAQTIASLGSNSHTSQTSTSSSGQVTEAVIDRYGDIYPDCYKSTREAPQEAYCVFCGETFRGDSSTENWLEHVGRQHLATLQPGRRGERNTGHYTINAAMPGFTQIEWLDDVTLQRWLLQYGEIVWNSDTGAYVLAGDSNTATTDVIAEDGEEGPDAEGEPDVDFYYLG